MSIAADGADWARGTTRGGQNGLESAAVSLITPPNGIGGGGICFPSIATVALGEPGVPVICWAIVGPQAKMIRAKMENGSAIDFTTSTPVRVNTYSAIFWGSTHIRK